MHVITLLKPMCLIENFGYVCLHHDNEKENISDEYAKANSHYCWWWVQTELFEVEVNYNHGMAADLQEKEDVLSGLVIENQ